MLAAREHPTSAVDEGYTPAQPSQQFRLHGTAGNRVDSAAARRGYACAPYLIIPESVYWIIPVFITTQRLGKLRAAGDSTGPDADNEPWGWPPIGSLRSG